jgi:hypothetical protein
MINPDITKKISTPKPPKPSKWVMIPLLNPYDRPIPIE